MEGIKQIAARLRGMREAENLSAETLAAELGLAEDKYAAYEAGAEDIPVGFLMRYAERFGMALAALLTGEEPRLRVYAVTRRGKGLAVERRSDYKYQSLAHEFAGKRAEPFLVRADPRPEGEPLSLNSHDGQEFNYVTEGRLLVSVGGREVVLEEGDSLYFDAAAPHGMRALGGKPASFIAVITK